MRDIIYARKRLYGLSQKDYETLYQSQNGRCAVCKRKRSILGVDHNHTTRQVRGLLCNTCNANLGFIEGKYYQDALIYLGRNLK